MVRHKNINLKVMLRVIKNAMQKGSWAKFKAERSQGLRDYLEQSIYNTWDIAYDNYSAENMLYSDQIHSELEIVMKLRNDLEINAYIQDFEHEFARRHGVRYAIGVSSATAALSLCLTALGIGVKDEVITTAHSYIATPLAITDIGAVPVFVDIQPDFNIASDQIEAKISERTKAILPVHIYGNPCAMDKIMRIAQKHNLHVIEDCAQAHGATFNAQKVGSFGNAGCFSFHASKIIGSLGDGGIILTDHKKLAQVLRNYRQPGDNSQTVLKSKRTPSRLDVVHIPFLRAKLRDLSNIIAKRKAHALQYNKAFKDIGQIICPEVKQVEGHCWRNYTIRVQDRDNLKKYLFTKGVQTKIFYDQPLYKRREFEEFKHKHSSLPVCEIIYSQILSLPISHCLLPVQIETIIKEIKKYYG